MKLDSGHLTTPVPWPIQSSPMASAIKPRIRSSLRMGPSSPAVLRQWMNFGLYSDIQQIVAGEFGLVGNKSKARLRLAAHQPFDGIGSAFAVVGQQHHAQQG